MTKTKIKRPGSGKTKGSFSFVKITLQDLSAKLAPSTEIVVRRIWAEGIGFTGLKSQAADIEIPNIVSAVPVPITAATSTVASEIDLSKV